MNSVQNGSLTHLNGSVRHLPSSSPLQVSLADMASYFKLLSETPRLKFLLELYRAPVVGVNKMAESMGLSQSVLSHHLTPLRLAGLVGCIRQGKRSKYQLTKLGRHVLETAVFGLIVQLARDPPKPKSEPEPVAI